MIKQELNENIKAVAVLSIFAWIFLQIWTWNWTENKHLRKHLLWGQQQEESTIDGSGAPSSMDSDYSTTHLSLSPSICS